MAKHKTEINPDAILADIDSGFRSVPDTTRTEGGVSVIGKDPADTEANQQLWNEFGYSGLSPTLDAEYFQLETLQTQRDIKNKKLVDDLYTDNDAINAVARVTLQAGSAIPRMLEWATGKAGEDGSLTRNISDAIGPAYTATDPSGIASVVSTVGGTIGEFMTGGGTFGKMLNYGLNVEKIAVGASKMRTAIQNPATGFAGGAFMQTMPQLEVEATDAGLKGVDKFNYVASQGMIEAVMTRIGGMSGLERMFDKNKFATSVSSSFMGRLRASGLMLAKESLRDATLEEMPIFVLQSVNSYLQGVDSRALNADRMVDGLWETFWISMLAAGAVNAPRAVRNLARSDQPQDIMEAVQQVELQEMVVESMGKQKTAIAPETAQPQVEPVEADQQPVTVDRKERAQQQAKESIDLKVKRGAGKRLAPLVKELQKNLPQGTTIEANEDAGTYTATTPAGYRIQYVMPSIIPINDMQGFAQSVVADFSGSEIDGITIPQTVEGFNQLNESNKQRIIAATQPKGAATAGQNIRVTTPSGSTVTLDGDVIIQLRDGSADLETAREEQHHATLQMMEMVDAPLNKRERRVLQQAAKDAGYETDVEGIYRTYRNWRDKPGKRGAMKNIADKIYDFFSKLAEISGFDPFVQTVFRRTEGGEQLAREGQRRGTEKRQSFSVDRDMEKLPEERVRSRGKTKPSDDENLVSIIKKMKTEIPDGSEMRNLINGYVKEDIRSFNVVGQKIESHADAAVLFAALRSPFVERFSWALTDSKNVIVHSGIYAIGDVSGVNAVTFNEIYSEIKNKPDDGSIFHVAHNHPSGNPRHSEPDRVVYESLESDFSDIGIGFRGIITNGDSYSSFENSVFSIHKKEIGKKFTKEGIPSSKIMSPDDLFEHAKNIQVNPDSVVQIVTDSRGSIVGVKAWRFVPTPEATELFRRSNAAGRSYFLVGDNDGLSSVSGARYENAEDIILKGESLKRKGSFFSLGGRDEGDVINEINEPQSQYVSRATDQNENIQDLVVELKDNGAEVINNKVTLYHITNKDSAEQINRTGKITGKEDGVFFTTKKDGQAVGFGDTEIKVSMPVERIVLDDVFGDEAHVKIPARIGESVNIRNEIDDALKPRTSYSIDGKKTPYNPLGTEKKPIRKKHRGKDAIMKRIAREYAFNGFVDLDDMGLIQKALDQFDSEFVSHVALSIRKQKEGQTELGAYDPAAGLMVLLGPSSGANISEVFAHEMGHSLERHIPKGDRADLNREFVNKKRAFIKKNPWFKELQRTGTLKKYTGKKPSDDELQDSYRFFNSSEYIAERVRELTFEDIYTQEGLQTKPAWRRAVEPVVRPIRNLFRKISRILGKDVGRRIFDDIRSGKIKPVTNEPEGVSGMQEYNPPTNYQIDKKQTDTPSFKKWFGDSKVVDEKGEPLVVYHGTDKSIDFTVARKQVWLTDRIDIALHYAGFNDVIAKNLYAKIENPLEAYDAEDVKNILRAQDWSEDRIDGVERSLGADKHKSWKWIHEGGDVVGAIKAAGFDGAKVHDDVIFDDGESPVSFHGSSSLEHQSWVIFDPEQIKSATDNRGTFDPADPRTTYSIADNSDRSQQEDVPAWQGTLNPFPRPAKETPGGGKIFVPMSEPEATVSRGTIGSWFRKYMTTAGNLPKDVARRKISAEGELAQIMNDVGAVTKNYRKAIKVEFPDGVNQKNLDDMNAFLKGEDFDGELSPRMQEALSMMRFQIDALSAQMVQHGIVDSALAAAIEDNTGVYLRRSYQIFDDPKWSEKVAPDVKNRAITWIREQKTVQKDPHEVAEMNENQLKQLISRYDIDIEIDDTTSREVMIDAIVMHEPNEADIQGELERLLLRGDEDSQFGSMSSKIGKKNLSMLKKRKNVPKVLRELWGEYTDPLTNYAKSVGGMANAIVNHRFLNDIVKNGEGVYLFKKPQPGFAKQISAEGNKAMEPMDGLYTSKEIHEVLTDYYSASSMGSIARTYMALNGFSKYSQTVLSHATQMRNVFGNTMFAIANADMNPLKFKHAFSALWADVAKKPDSEWRQYYKKMQDLGVIGESVHGGEIRAVIKDAVGKDLDKYLDSMWKRALAAPGKVAQKAYESGDDLWKIFAYENEFDKLKKAYPDSPIGDLELEAAEIVRNTFPTYSNIPAGIRYIRRMPFFGTFVSFPAEVTRVTYNTILQIGKELKSGNPIRRRQGIHRLMGMGMAMVLADAAWIGSMALLGIGDDEDEAFRHTGVPDWSKNSAIVYLNDDKTDRMWMDLGQFDPYAVVKDPLRTAYLSLMRGDDAQKTAIQFAGEALMPYVSEDMMFQKILDIKRNQTIDGRSVYNEEGSMASQWADMGKHFGTAITPGTIKSMQRQWHAQTGKIVGRRKYDPTAETLAQFGLRVQATNLPRNFTYSMRDYSRSKGDTKRLLSDTARSLGEVTDDQLRDAYVRSDKAGRRAFADAVKHVNDMRLFGYSNNQIVALLTTGGISGDSVGAVLNGIYKPFVPAESYFQNILVQSTVSDVSIDEAAAKFAKRLVVMTESAIDAGADAGPRLEFYRALGNEIAWDAMRKIDEKQIKAVGGSPRDVKRAVMQTKRANMPATRTLGRSRKLLKSIESLENENIKKARTRMLMNSLKKRKNQ